MAESSTRFVGNIPENYDRGLGPVLFEDFAVDLAARALVHKAEKIVELAAGTGIVTRRLRDALPDDCDLLASDLNAPMLAVAQAKFDAEESVGFETADATDLRFGDGEFDLVTCQFGVMFFPDKAKSYSEVQRVLKPGGNYVFNVWGSWDKNPYAEIVHHVIADFFPDNPPGFYRVPFGYYDIDEIRDALALAGFSNIKIESNEIISEIPSAHDFAQGIIFGNPVIEEIMNRNGDPDQIRDAVTHAIEENLGDSMPLQAIFFEAEK